MDILEDLRTIDKIARRAVRRSFAVDLVDFREAFETARGAIVELIAERSTRDEECPEADLVKAGWDAVAALSRESKGDSSLRSRIYWLPKLVVPSCEEPIVEKMALTQVFTLLSDREQELLLTFTAHTDINAAARHLGITPAHMKVEIRKARQRFFTWWFDWEELPKLPPLPRARGQRLAEQCGHGHEWTPENTGYHRGSTTKARTQRYCIACSNMHGAARNERRRQASQHSEGTAS